MKKPQSSYGKNILEVIKVLPVWFTLFLAIAYASGFISEFTFLDRFGIRESGGDFFRVKYIYIGILFLLFPISILIPSCFALSLKRITDKHEKPNPRTAASDPEKPPFHENEFVILIPAMLSLFNMCLVFYAYALFVPRDFVFDKQIVLPLIFLVSVVGPILINSFVKYYIVPHKSKSFSNNARWLLLLPCIGLLDNYAFNGFAPQLWKIFWGKHLAPDGAVYYFALMIMIPLILWQTNFHAQKAPTERAKSETQFLGFFVVIMFYFLGILAFALRVYPQIPAAKGGGNYVESPCVTINFRPIQGVFPIVNVVNDVERELSLSNNFIIIDQTPASIFLAKTNEAGGPEEWGKMRKLPSVVEVRFDSVDQIIYSPIVDHNYEPNGK